MRVISFGINETRWLREGWHERETWGDGLVYRNTSGRAVLSLEWARAGAGETSGASSSGASRIGASRIGVLLCAHATGAGGRMSMTLWVGGREVASAEMRDDRWRLIEAPLPAAGTDAMAGGEVLEIRSDPVYVPDRLLHNGDRRALGVRVAALRMLDGDPSDP